jgi:hypothetical protein
MHRGKSSKASLGAAVITACALAAGTSAARAQNAQSQNQNSAAAPTYRFDTVSIR